MKARRPDQAHLITSDDVPVTPSCMRARHAVVRARVGDLPSQTLDLVKRPDTIASFRRTIELDAARGLLKLSVGGNRRLEFSPLVEGQLLFKNQKLIKAYWNANVLAVLWRPIEFQTKQNTRLGFFITPDNKLLGKLEGVFGAGTVALSSSFEEWKLLGYYQQPPAAEAVALSSDGRFFARQTAVTDAEIRSVVDASRVIATVPRGGCHTNDIEAYLGDFWLSIEIDQRSHLIQWKNEELSWRHWKGRLSGYLLHDLPGSSKFGPPSGSLPLGLPGSFAPDPLRFTRFAVNTLVAVGDRYGQFALFEHSGKLLCMVFAFRRRVAVWMPDGTCFGSPDLLGGAPTPGAADKIGRALKEASLRGMREARADR
jgi:hypothetical protein